MSNASIPESAKRCRDSLADLVAAIVRDDPITDGVQVHGHLQGAEALEERFNQWASNLGALQASKSPLSLEHRLKESAVVRDIILQLLQDLCDSVQTATKIIMGESENRRAEPLVYTDTDLEEYGISSSESDSGLSSASDSVGGRYVATTNATSELDQLMLGIKTSIDNLFKTSIFIRKSALRDRRKRLSNTKPFDSQADTMYIADRYRGMEQKNKPLITRLGVANARRRQYFKYRRDHHDRLSRVEPEKATTVITTTSPKDETWLESRPATTAPPVTLSSRSRAESSLVAETKATDFEATPGAGGQLSALLLDVPPQAMSVTSFATSIAETPDEDSAFPPLPEEAETSSPFVCPYCWEVVSLKRGRGPTLQWRNHVLKDLEPYICTFPGCGLEPYSSQHAWFEHELLVHRSRWHCPKCSDIFNVSQQLEDHVAAQHSEGVSRKQIEAVVTLAKRPVDSIAPDECPFCDEEWASADQEATDTMGLPIVVNVDQFRQHVGHHLQQVALFSLPRLNQKDPGIGSNLVGGNPDQDDDGLKLGHRWVREDCGFGWGIIAAKRPTFIALAYFLSSYRKLRKTKPDTLYMFSSTAKSSRLMEAFMEGANELRELGAELEYKMPQIIVCGSKFAGKSSVLQSLFQIPFARTGRRPYASYATEVTFLPAATPSVQVRIQPGDHRPLPEAMSLRSFYRHDKSGEYATMLTHFMEEANQQIHTFGIPETMNTEDILLITIYKPGAYPLRVIDLPGPIDDGNNNNNTASRNHRIIHAMAASHMAMPQSVIVAVVSAIEGDPSYLTASATCSVHDPAGERSLGVITMPDRAAEDFQRDWAISLIRESPRLHPPHTWHVLRNRTPQEADISPGERDDRESVLLGSSPWRVVDKSRRGIDELRKRLCDLLFRLGDRELARSRDAIRDRLARLKEEFDVLGGDGFQREEELQRSFMRSIRRLSDAVRDHARGLYEADARLIDETGTVNLRARVDELGEIFRDKLIADGPDWDAWDWEQKANIGRHEKNIHHAITQTLMSSREGVPPAYGTTDLFRDLSEGWDAISREHIERVHLCCERYFQIITPITFAGPSSSGNTDGFSSPQVATRFLESYIMPKLDRCKEEAMNELLNLEQDRRDPAFITNLGFLRNRAATDKPLGTGTGRQAENIEGRAEERLLGVLRSTCLSAQDIYITNVLRQVIERHFLRHLWDILPKSLSLEEARELTRRDGDEEARAREIAKKVFLLQTSLNTLEDIPHTPRSPQH